MRRIISALFFSLSTTLAVAQSAKPIELAPDAPDRHVVVKGDTLWGISAKFLKDPFRWPEVWRMNEEQVRNPHLIYPGQVVILDRSGAGGEPQLRLGTLHKAEPKVYSASDRDAIPAIPQNVIEPFLSQPLVVEEDELNQGPRIVAIEESRVNAGQDNKIYASGIAKSESSVWNLYRPGRPLVDPDTGESLGIEAVYLGDARVTREATSDEEATTLRVTKGKLEISRGDNLKAATEPELLNYIPHAPKADINGKVISIYGGVGEAGKFSIITISRGKRDGLDVGHVLAIYRTGSDVTNNFPDGKQSIRLPDERFGLLFVFRVFEKVSYALVMEAERPVIPRDTVKNP